MVYATVRRQMGALRLLLWQYTVIVSPCRQNCNPYFGYKPHHPCDDLSYLAVGAIIVARMPYFRNGTQAVPYENLSFLS